MFWVVQSISVQTSGPLLTLDWYVAVLVVLFVCLYLCKMCQDMYIFILLCMKCLVRLGSVQGIVAVYLLPAHASKQGNVIGLVSVYIRVCVCVY